jgi:hypothetical protein
MTFRRRRRVNLPHEHHPSIINAMSSLPPPLPPRIPPLMAGPALPPPGRSSRRAIWIGLIALGLLLAGVAGYAGWRDYQSRALPARENVTIQEKHRETEGAFASDSLPATDQETRDISGTLDQLNAAMQQGNYAAMMAMFDTDRLCDELDRAGAFSSLSDADKKATRSGIAIGLGRGFMSQLANLRWTSHSVKKIVFSGNRKEVVVYDLERHGSGPQRTSTKVRWWLRKNGTQWQLWDMESLDSGLRVSTLMCSLMASAGSGGMQLSPLTQFTSQVPAISGAMQKGDLVTAESGLKALGRTCLAAAVGRRPPIPLGGVARAAVAFPGSSGRLRFHRCHGAGRPAGQRVPSDQLQPSRPIRQRSAKRPKVGGIAGRRPRVVLSDGHGPGESEAAREGGRGVRQIAG